MTRTAPDRIEVNGYALVQDARCGYWKVDPYPSLDFLDAFYSKDYRMKFPPFALERLARQIDGIRTSGRTALDIGCAEGPLLEALQDRGWTCYGLEPSVECSQAARKKGLDVATGSIFGTLPERPAVDVLILDNVVEHLPDPEVYLPRLVERYLKDGGIAFIQVPNDFNPLQLAYTRANPGKAHYWVHPPAHLNYFNTEAIRRFVENCGLEVIKVEQDFPMELFLLMGKDYQADPAVGRECHAMRVAFHEYCERIGQPELIDAFFEAMCRLGWGRVTSVYARYDARSGCAWRS